MNLNALNLTAIWGAITTTVIVLGWMWSNLAFAADIERIEKRQIRSDVMDQCYKWATAPEGVKAMVGRFVMDSVDELCDLNPDDKKCNMTTPEEVCL